ncbi:MAG: chorismate-binding protein, partial [Chitinophagaceae bacterium]
MKNIAIHTTCKKLLADVFTPVGIYLRLRDRFRDTVLLESSDHHAAENSWSFIGIHAIGGMEITSLKSIEFKLPGQKPTRQDISNTTQVPQLLFDFMNRFEVTGDHKEARFAQGLYGYTTYDAVQFFDTIQLGNPDSQLTAPFSRLSSRDSLLPTPGPLLPASNSLLPSPDSLLPTIPLMRYRLYQYVIAINHHKDELYLCENTIAGIESELQAVESLIRSKDVPVFPFKICEEESSNCTNEEYMEMVKKGISSCLRGDVFQIVLSRRFQQSFTGDEFNVYRALRNINPSPYLFFFDYGDYKLMGSSPESQIIIKNGKAIVHPIAGTFKRTGDDETDHLEAERLLKDAKENAEHVMLV